MREMVAYIIDATDKEVIDSYTDTFVNIAQEYSIYQMANTPH